MKNIRLWIKRLLTKKKVSWDYSINENHDYTVKTTYKMVDGVLYILNVEYFK